MLPANALRLQGVGGCTPEHPIEVFLAKAHVRRFINTEATYGTNNNLAHGRWKVKTNDLDRWDFQEIFSDKYLTADDGAATSSRQDGDVHGTDLLYLLQNFLAGTSGSSICGTAMTSRCMWAATIYLLRICNRGFPVEAGHRYAMAEHSS